MADLGEGEVPRLEGKVECSRIERGQFTRSSCIGRKTDGKRRQPPSCGEREQQGQACSWFSPPLLPSLVQNLVYAAYCSGMVYL